MTATEAIAHFTGMQKEIVETEQKLKDLMGKYKQETKAYFGVSDGDPMNLIQLASLITKFSGKPVSVTPEVHGVGV